MTYPIPDVALDSDISILGRKGSGKSYTAKGIAERLLDMQRRLLVLDPLGIWRGLRASADGERPGYPIAVFGGERGDMPLDPAAAIPLADIIATENLPAVLDLAELSKGAQQAFLLAFLGELRRVNTEALTIILEEADVFAPQNPQGDDSKALHGEIDWISRRGRFKGFRLISICQRPARLSKDVLTQANMLIMHRLPSPQDQGAGLDWIKSNGDLGKAQLVADSLGSLKVGEAWVLAQEPPMLERVTFPRIKTLDTSSTPKAGERRIEPKTLAQVDIEPIRAALAAARAAAASPKGKAPPAAAPDKGQLAAEFQRGFDEGHAAGNAEARHRLGAVVLDFAGAFAWAADVPSSANLIVIDPLSKRDAGPASEVNPPLPAKAAEAAPSQQSLLHIARPKGAPTRESLLASAPVKMAASIWPLTLPWAQLMPLIGRKADGGNFYALRKRLLAADIVREGVGQRVILAEPPARSAGVIPADVIEQALPTRAAQMFAHIRRNPGASWESVAAALGVKADGGNWYAQRKILLAGQAVEERPDGLFVSPALLGKGKSK